MAEFVDEIGGGTSEMWSQHDGGGLCKQCDDDVERRATRNTSSSIYTTRQRKHKKGLL